MVAGLALGILALAGVGALQGSSPYVGNYWVILAGGLLTVAHSALLLAAAGNLYGIREGYRRRNDRSRTFAPWISLETMLIAGAVCVLAGSSILAGVLGYWSAQRFVPLLNVLPAVLGTSLIVIGAQNILGGFMIAIVNGNDADFVRPAPIMPASSVPASRSASLVPNEVV
jgi:hypothetical protein